VRIQRPQAGFSYIELLVAMVIGVTLYAVVLGPSEATKRKRDMAECAEHLRKLHLTLSLYANEHNGAFPAVKNARRTEEVFRLLSPQYTTDQSFFGCPKGGGYSYVMGLTRDAGIEVLAADKLTSHLLKPGAPLFSKHGNHGEYGNILFTDGHVEAGGATVERDMSHRSRVEVVHP
jgi:prepilin-type processing-associated H-X9-DG protein